MGLTGSNFDDSDTVCLDRPRLWRCKHHDSRDAHQTEASMKKLTYS